MITQKAYKNLTSTYWLGKRVKLLRAIETCAGSIYPDGAKAIITEKFKGFSLRSDPCACCGVQLRLSRVRPEDLEMVEESEVGQ